MNKKLNFIRAIIFALAAFILITLFWRFLGNLAGHQTGYLAWAWTAVRKITTLGFSAMAFFGGLE